jgi:cell division protein FtsB
MRSIEEYRICKRAPLPLVLLSFFFCACFACWFLCDLVAASTARCLGLPLFV